MCYVVGMEVFQAKENIPKKTTDPLFTQSAKLFNQMGNGAARDELKEDVEAVLTSD